ncbi:MAG: FHA domain-containing protein [Rhizobacter sp.]|nr:FHA domain-containing protein [Rhizobacter sp.]
MGEVTTTLAVLEVLDRDGGVRHSVAVQAWPLRVGRALDNDLVLDDPYTAPQHFSIAPDDDGRVVVAVGESVNGLQVDGHRLAAGSRWVVPTGAGDAPPLLTAGRTHLRLRLPAHALPPEQPLGVTRVLTQGLPTLAGLALATALVLGFGTWLENDPDLFTKALASFAISALATGLAWSGLWTLLSKVFTRQGHFGWHLRVMLMAVLAWQAVTAGTALLAFAFSWPWLTDFNFIPGYVIAGATLYFHLQAVEPLHRRRTLALAMASAVVGVALSFWFNLQGSDRAGSELYMNHLFPPALRVAKPVDTAHFMQGVADLQPRLDANAQKDDEHE